MASLLLPVLSQAKERTNRIVCLNNSRQIGIALLNYIADNQETFPAANSFHLTEQEDWLYWDGKIPGSLTVFGTGDPRATGASPIARYLAGFNTNLFRCPSDRILKSLDQNASLDPELTASQAYRFSYSLSAGGDVDPLCPVRPGMASVIDRNFAAVYYFKAGFIGSPSAKIMVAEERTVFEGPRDERYVCAMTSGWIWSGSWMYWRGGGWDGLSDKLTARHSSRGNQTFADGHVETVKPQLGLMPEHCNPWD